MGSGVVREKERVADHEEPRVFLLTDVTVEDSGPDPDAVSWRKGEFSGLLVEVFDFPED